MPEELIYVGPRNLAGTLFSPAEAMECLPGLLFVHGLGSSQRGYHGIKAVGGPERPDNVPIGRMMPALPWDGVIRDISLSSTQFPRQGLALIAGPIQSHHRTVW